MIDNTSKRIFKRIKTMLEKWAEDHPGVSDHYYGLRLESDASKIDDGTEDTRPEFVKRDEVGWRRLK